MKCNVGINRKHQDRLETLDFTCATIFPFDLPVNKLNYSHVLFVLINLKRALFEYLSESFVWWLCAHFTAIAAPAYWSIVLRAFLGSVLFSSHLLSYLFRVNNCNRS